MNIINTSNTHLTSIDIKMQYDYFTTYEITKGYENWFRDNDIIFYKFIDIRNDNIIYRLNSEDALIFKLKFGI